MRRPAKRRGEITASLEHPLPPGCSGAGHRRTQHGFSGSRTAPDTATPYILAKSISGTIRPRAFSATNPQSRTHVCRSPGGSMSVPITRDCERCRPVVGQHGRPRCPVARSGRVLGSDRTNRISQVIRQLALIARSMGGSLPEPGQTTESSLRRRPQLVGYWCVVPALDCSSPHDGTLVANPSFAGQSPRCVRLMGSSREFFHHFVRQLAIEGVIAQFHANERTSCRTTKGLQPETDEGGAGKNRRTMPTNDRRHSRRRHESV